MNNELIARVEELHASFFAITQDQPETESRFNELRRGLYAWATSQGINDDSVYDAIVHVGANKTTSLR